MTSSTLRCESVRLLFAGLLLQLVSLASGCNGVEESGPPTSTVVAGAELRGVGYADGRFVVVGGMRTAPEAQTYTARGGGAGGGGGGRGGGGPGAPRRRD